MLNTRGIISFLQADFICKVNDSRQLDTMKDALTSIAVPDQHFVTTSVESVCAQQWCLHALLLHVCDLYA